MPNDTNSFFSISGEPTAIVLESKIAYEMVKSGSQDDMVSLRQTSPTVLEVTADCADDFIFSWTSGLFVSRRVLNLAENLLTGWSFSPVLLDNSGRADALWQVDVNGFAGFATNSHKIRVTRRDDSLGLYQFGLEGPFVEFIDFGKWDGSDIFTIWPYPLRRIVTKRFKDTISALDLTGLHFDPIESETVGPKATPGVPQQWLTEKNMKRLHADPDFRRVVDS